MSTAFHCVACGTYVSNQFDSVGEWTCRIHPVAASPDPVSGFATYACCGLRSMDSMRAAAGYYAEVFEEDLAGCVRCDHLSPARAEALETKRIPMDDVHVLPWHALTPALQQRIASLPPERRLHLPFASVSSMALPQPYDEVRPRDLLSVANVMLSVPVAVGSAPVVQKDARPLLQRLLATSYYHAGFHALPRVAAHLARALHTRDTGPTAVPVFPPGSPPVLPDAQTHVRDYLGGLAARSLSDADYFARYLTVCQNLLNLPVPVVLLRAAAPTRDADTVAHIHSFNAARI